MAKQSDEVRALLAMFACQLRRLKFPSSPIPVPLAKFVATAIEDYLCSPAKTLDAAFGLGAKRGRPVSKTTEHEALAQRVFDLRMDGKSWKEIADILSKSRTNGEPDIRTVRRIYAPHFVPLALEKIQARDILPDHSEAEDRPEAEVEPRKRRPKGKKPAPS